MHKRFREFVTALMENTVPTELRIALPNGLTKARQENLGTAAEAIDDITCSTIHGFCQRLIKPYPADADIDPGADIIHPDQADLVFLDIVETWLRERLSEDRHGMLAAMVLRDPDRTIALFRTMIEHLHWHRTATVATAEPLAGLVRKFRENIAAFRQFMASAEAAESETDKIVAHFEDMADFVKRMQAADDPASLLECLLTPAHADLCTASGIFLKYRKKGKWFTAAQQAGLAKARWRSPERCCHALLRSILFRLDDIAGNYFLPFSGGSYCRNPTCPGPFLEVQARRRSAHFDDLLFAARDLLSGNDDVRRALARRFAHILVDEFQDTDPLQVEIFWHLCGIPPDNGSTEDWEGVQIRPRALFLVGDPKQAIYRFRGADLGTYVRARDMILEQDPDCVISISTNFRCRAPILAYVNDCFEEPLSSDGQPGFTKLDPFHAESNDMPCVAALDVAVADENGKAMSEQKRNGEAEAVAEICARLIGGQTILDRKTGEIRLCRAGDIALLTPTGNNLWRYEEALERFRIPVATQAGKGLFQRQEIQDLIALTRVLSDPRDTLAISTLLRGPLVGLTEEDLLDIVWALPHAEHRLDALPRLDLNVDLAAIPHALARNVLGKIQTLRHQTNTTTPHNLISQAADALRIRPILRERHGGQTERAFAEADLYLSLAQGYSVRGLRAFAEAMTAAWTDESRAVEGRPDSQEEAVALYIMHAAKRLEWSIVIPVNTLAQVMVPDRAFVNRENNQSSSPVFGIPPVRHKDALTAEKPELDCERTRLWYVATRAQDLLVLPRLDVDPASNSWLALIDLALTRLPAIDLTSLSTEPGSVTVPPVNTQTREIFSEEAQTIVERRRPVRWVIPSRDEEPT